MDVNAVKVHAPHHFLHGDGEMVNLTREFSWAHTSVGAPEHWPQSLKTTVGIVLHSAFPMFLFWGTDHICFYNDAFRPSLGNEGKHPAIGKTGREVWAEIWEFIGPLVAQVMSTGTPVWYEDQLVPFYRNGKVEDIYWTFSYSPAYGDDGKIAGVVVTCHETTDKVKNIARLEESQKRFQNLVRDTTVGIIVLSGPGMTIAMVNEAYGKLIGKTCDELQGRELFSIVPESAKRFRPIIEKVRCSGEPVHLYDQPVHILKDGVERDGFLNLVYQPYKEEDGRITGVMVLCHDVTDQVTDRRQSQQSEQQVRSLVESAPFPIGVYIGREMKIMFANKSIIEAWGKGEDVIGKRYSDILPELDNQDIFKQLEEVFDTGIPFHARNQRVDLVVSGILQSYYFNYSFTPLYNADGTVYGVMNTAADVTDLNIAKQKVEQSETNFRNMILQAPVAMCILIGPQHIVAVANELMIELWGKPSKDVMFKPIFEGLPDARQQGLEALMNAVYQTGEPFTANERPVNLLRNGQLETVYQNFVYQPYKDPNGVILGVLAISIDVTAQVLARRKIEEVVSARTKELADANTNLEQSNAELAQFAYIASHDLQEPLRKVSTFAQMLEQSLGSIDERSQKYLDKINNATLRMSTLIKDVLNYSQLSAERDVFTDVDLLQVLENARNDFELLVEQLGATIIAEELPVIKAIPLQMAQLFGNLISNSLKFSRKDKKPVITIAASLLAPGEPTDSFIPDKSKTYYNISFRDNGIGIKQEYAGQIFNIFQRLHGKSEYAGTGIGLAMCKKIAQNHKGDIYATASTDDGAVINVILPA